MDVRPRRGAPMRNSATNELLPAPVRPHKPTRSPPSMRAERRRTTGGSDGAYLDLGRSQVIVADDGASFTGGQNAPQARAAKLDGSTLAAVDRRRPAGREVVVD